MLIIILENYGPFPTVTIVLTLDHINYEYITMCDFKDCNIETPHIHRKYVLRDEAEEMMSNCVKEGIKPPRDEDYEYYKKIDFSSEE